MTDVITCEELNELIKNIKIANPRPYTHLFTSASYDAWKTKCLYSPHQQVEIPWTTWEPIKKIDFNKAAVFTATMDKPVNMEMLGFESNQTAISLSREDIEEVSESLFNGI